MKIKFLTFLVAVGCLIVSCDNNDDNDPIAFEATGTITGFDLTLCACCGGWIIDIDGGASDRRFSEVPENATIDLEKETLPIKVQFNWSESDEYCGKGIQIDAMELID